MDRETICELIPHDGTMCLLEEVADWGEDWIRCRTGCHHWPDHPLAREGRLAPIHALEIGAQAVAVHGGLLATRKGHTGGAVKYLAAIRSMDLAATSLDQFPGDLWAWAQCLGSQGQHGIYQIRVTSGEETVLAAQITVMGQGGGEA